MTIKATFPDGSVMLFGDSYRRWFDQLREFCATYNLPRPNVVKCAAEWVGYGGLKWCPERALQGELDSEGKGRTLVDFSEWKPLNQIEMRTLKKHVREFPLNDEHVHHYQRRRASITGLGL